MRDSVIMITFFCLLVYSDQRSTPQDDSYVAAVVEYQVQANVDTNLQNYVQLIQNASAQNADIVVFPEMTLTRSRRAVTVPIYELLKEYPIPALVPELYDEILANISTAARQNEVYVVINIQEEMNCADINSTTGEDCPAPERYLFNTNVVFDRTGAVIDRYRKINLFGEYMRTPALKPDLGEFATDFGVTFGHFICFDLMFQVPAIQVVEKRNLTDIIFTTMWFSEMPYLTAVQIQEAYAYAMNVNFLASGANNVAVGSAGSGIYSGKAGALVSIMPGLPTTRLLVSRVPKIPGQVNFATQGPIYDNPEDHDSLVLISDPSLPAHISRALLPGFQEFTLVDKDVSCKFTVRINQRNGATNRYYRAFVKDGTNTYSKRQVGVAFCLIVACKSNDPKSCPYRFDRADKSTEFEELKIKMSTYRHHYNDSLKCNDIVYLPSSFQSSKFPLNPENITFVEASRNGGREAIKYKINAPQEELVSFGVWGRIFTRDVDFSKEVTKEEIENYIEIENGIYFHNDRDK